MTYEGPSVSSGSQDYKPTLPGAMTGSVPRSHTGLVTPDNAVTHQKQMATSLEAGKGEVSGGWSLSKGWFASAKAVASEFKLFSRNQTEIRPNDRNNPELVTPRRGEGWMENLSWLIRAEEVNVGTERGKSVSHGVGELSTSGKPSASRTVEKDYWKGFINAEFEPSWMPKFEVFGEAANQKKTGLNGKTKISPDAKVGGKGSGTATNISLSPNEDIHIAPNGMPIDRNTHAGEQAFQNALEVSSHPDLQYNSLNIIPQKESSDASNLAMNVPNFDYRGSSGQGSETVAVRADPTGLQNHTVNSYSDTVGLSYGGHDLTGNETNATVTRSVEDPNKVSAVEVDGTRYVPVEAIADWASYQGDVNRTSYGDFRHASADRIAEVNEGRITTWEVDGREIRTIEETHVINTGFATVKDVGGVIQADNIDTDAATTEIKGDALFWGTGRRF